LLVGTTTSMRSRSSSSTTLATSAGASALTTKVAMSCDHGMMSIFSPWQLVDHRLHARAAHADAGADRVDRRVAEITAILAREPGSRATALTSDDAVVISGTSWANSFAMIADAVRDRKICGPRGPPHVVDIGADTVAVAEHLARQHSSRRTIASPRPRSTTTLPYSTRLTCR